MSLSTIYYTIEQDSLDLGGMLASEVSEALERAFGPYPIELSHGKDVDKLLGMASTCRNDNNAYTNLIGLLLNHGGVTLTGVE